MNLLTPNGFLCYITSNKWMRAGYGEALRGYFASKTNPIMLVDFAGIKIFDAITVEANILLSQKAANIFICCFFLCLKKKGEGRHLHQVVQKRK